MKTGDLIKMPRDHGIALVLKVGETRHDDGVISRYVKCLAPYGEDLWDADYCEVISESR